MENHLLFKRNCRIAFICFSYALGGLELSVLRLASQLEKRMVDVTIFAPPDSLLAKQAEKNRIRIIPFKPKWKYLDIIGSFKLARLLKLYRIDTIIVMQSQDLNLVALSHFFSSGLKLIFYQQMQSGIDKKDIFHNWIYSKLSNWITLTDKMRNETIEHTCMNPKKISTVNLGIDIKRFDPSLYDKILARQMFNIPQNRFVIGMIGRLDPQKGQMEFIRSIPALIQHHDNLYFVIAGDETVGQKGYKNLLIDMSVELEIKDHLQFIPFTESVPELLSAFDVYVLPSHSETYGLVLIEAMAMGKAIVATNAGGVPEILTDKHTGLLILPKDFSSLTEAILILLKDEKQRQLFAANARIEALKRFDINETINGLIKIIDSLQN